MDFVSNMWSKTGLKKTDQEDKQELDPSADNPNATTDKDQLQEQQQTDQQKNGSSKVGFVSGFIKSTFNKGDASERKTSVADSDQVNKQEDPGNAGGAKGFVTNMFKNPFKKDGDTSRKPSDAGSLTGVTATGESSENKEGEERLVEGDGNDSHVGQKAIDSAKSFGGFLVNVASKAGHTVSATATKLKHTVESNSLLADFTKEQQEFMKEHGSGLEASDPPWVGVENEEEVKKEIISLSQDKRNFVRNPPAGLTFEFDLQSSLPVALSILKEDPQLAKMRFEVVPKLVNEETFWRNYFYRISLVKQSTAAHSLKSKSKGWGSTSSSEAEGPDDEISPSNDTTEFVSDTFQGDVSAEEVRKGMKALGVKRGDSKTSASDEKWEEELKKDLQEFEVVGGSEIPEEELDKDLADLM